MIGQLLAYNTLVVLAGVGLLGASAGLIGSFAVLRKQSLTSDAVAHAALPGVCLAFLLLGAVFIFNGTLWCLGIAAFAAKAATRIRQSEGAIAWINRALGGLFVYLGVRVAMLEAR